MLKESIRMTENKRFVIDDNGYLIDGDTHKLIEYDEECCNLLNELVEENESITLLAQHIYEERKRIINRYVDKIKELERENKELKSILQDMGLIMSNEEVKNVRDEIASKLIKQLCKENGFDVDINTENGFTISYKR